MMPSTTSDHVNAYMAYVLAALARECVPVRLIGENHDSSFEFGLVVQCDGPFDQYDRDTKPGRWLRTMLRGETVHDVIAAYRKTYNAEGQ